MRHATCFGGSAKHLLSCFIFKQAEQQLCISQQIIAGTQTTLKQVPISKFKSTVVHLFITYPTPHVCCECQWLLTWAANCKTLVYPKVASHISMEQPFFSGFATWMLPRCFDKFRELKLADLASETTWVLKLKTNVGNIMKVYMMYDMNIVCD